MIPCPSCAAQLPPEARFCPACGHAVGVSQSEERRIVTVLFADLVGFTGLAEHLDPEQVKRFIEGAFAQLVDDVTAFGGSVDKLLGDGLLALFGAPVAHEDDAERAVRAGLRMQRTLEAYVHESSLDVPVTMRVGVNTGEVLVGTLAGTEYTAMGDVVNTASRIQSEAPPFGVLVGEATHALTAGAIQYDEAVEISLRGREHSVTTWLARDTLVPPGSRNRRHDLRLVGRSGELALGEAAISLAVTERRNLLVNVIGESGVGKSRLVDELLDSVGDDVLLLEGACAPYGEVNVWSPLATALAGPLGVEGTASADEVRVRAVRKATAMFGADAESSDAARVVEVLLHLLGHPSSLDGLDQMAARSAVHRAVAQVIEGRCAMSPVVLSIDDLHWADQVLIDLLEHLISTLGRLPFVVITAMRPGSAITWPPHNLERTSVVSLSVQPLARQQSDQLVFELLGESIPGVATDQRLLDALFDRSGGNPLFLQELAVVAAADGASTNLPDSLRALIAARLDQLSPAERQVLDNAATLGVAGTVSGLETFASEMRQVFDPAVMAQLDAKGFLQLEGRRWRFPSDSVREATYQTITKASRAQRHAGVAAFLAVTSPAALDDLAHHTATAAEIVAELGRIDGVPSSIHADAIRFLSSAAERARETGSQRLGIRHATRAIDLLGDDPAGREKLIRLRLLRGAALIELRDYVHARGDLMAVLDDSAERDDVEAEGEARLLMGSVHHLEGDQAAARAELGQSVELLRAAGSTSLLAGALRQRGFIELFGGSLVDAEWFFGEAEATYRELDDERGLAYVEQYRAWLSFLSGDLDLADERLHHAADTLNRLGDRNGVGWAFGLLAFVRFFQRRFDEAEDLAVLVRSEAMERGDDWAAAMMQVLLADLRLWQGDLASALDNAEQARNRFRRLSDKFGLIQALAPLIRAQVALGRTAAMQRTSEELLALADGSPLGPVPLLAVAGAAMHRGDGQFALTTIDRAIAEMLTMRSGLFEAHVVRTISLVQLGRLDEALVEFDLIPDHESGHPFARAAAALLQSLSNDHEAVLREAELVRSITGASYLDRAMAAVVAAGAHASLDDRASAVDVIEEALAESTQVGDVVAMNMLQLAHVRVVGVAHASGAGSDAAVGAGWITVIGSLPVLNRVR